MNCFSNLSKLFFSYIILMDLIVNLHIKFYNEINLMIEPILERYSDGQYMTPNYVTYFRTLLVIPAIILIYYEQYIIGSLLIVLNDFLDFFDGVVARVHKKKGIVYDQVYGSFIDAFADKVFNCTLWGYLLFRGNMFILTKYILIAQFVMEIILGSTRIYSYFQGKILHADHYGKTKQTLETIGSALLIIPVMQYIGMVSLALSIYFSYMSIYNKIFK